MVTNNTIKNFILEEINKLELDLGGPLEHVPFSTEAKRGRPKSKQEGARSEAFKCGQFIGLAKVLNKIGYEW